MSEGNKELVKAKKEGLEAVVNKLFATKTPKQFIKTRPGPGGLRLTYVEVGYVVSVLNNAFGPFWEWRVTDKNVGDKQIWVQGELTVKSPEMSITKTGFGGATIKRSVATKDIVNIANDLKAASSDALKKAASLFGIACDVFYKEMDLLEESPEEIDEVEDGNKFVRQSMISKFFALASERGFSGEKAKELIKTAYNVEHMDNLTNSQLEKGITAMETKYQVVQDGEEPLKVGEIRKQVIDTNGEIEIVDEHFDEDVGEIKLDKECRQCGKVVPEGNIPEWFCNEECQDKYWGDKKASVV